MDKRIASRGGKATVAKHGSDHMATIGRRGFAATVNKHWQGDAQSYLMHQRARANESVMETLAEMKLDAELAKGNEVASIELNELEDYEPERWEDRVSRQIRGKGRAG